MTRKAPMPFVAQKCNASRSASAFSRHNVDNRFILSDLESFSIAVAVVVRNRMGSRVNWQHRPRRKSSPEGGGRSVLVFIRGFLFSA